MAVVVQCYHCSNILELDEGFRGGVCRCSQCGSLLQVPKSPAGNQPIERPASPGSGLRRPASPRGDTGLSRGQLDPRSGSGVRPAEPGSGSGAFARASRPAAPVQAPAEGGNGGNDLAALAEAALHTPAAGAGAAHVLHEPGATRRGVPEETVRKSNTLIYVGLTIIGVLVILAAVLGFLLVGSGNKASRPAPEQQGTAGGDIKPVPPSAGSPTFLTVPLVGDHILFSLDAGSSAQETLDFVRLAVKNALPHLASDQQVKIVLWQESGLKSFPESGWISKGDLEKIREPLENVGAWGRTDPAASMKASLKLAEGRAQVIFVSAKADLQAELAAPVLEARGTARIDAVRIAGSAEAAAGQNLLEILATRGGGRYVSLDAKQLETMALQSGRRE